MCQGMEIFILKKDFFGGWEYLWVEIRPIPYFFNQADRFGKSFLLGNEKINSAVKMTESVERWTNIAL